MSFKESLAINLVQLSSYEDVLGNSTEQDEGGSSQLLCLLSFFSSQSFTTK